MRLLRISLIYSILCILPGLLTGVTRAQMVTNEFCPVLPDEKVESNISVQYEGKTVFLCCGGCLKKFKANPTAFVGNLPQFKVQTAEPIVNLPEASKATPEEVIAAEHGFWLRFAAWLGRFHVLVIHFPIALFIMAALAEVSAMFSVSPRWRQISGYNLLFSAIGAIVASSLGWLLAIGWTGTPALLDTLEKHRVMGLVFSGLNLVCLLFWLLEGRYKFFLLRAFYLFLLFAGVIMITITAHLGGTLVYGPNYFRW